MKIRSCSLIRSSCASTRGRPPHAPRASVCWSFCCCWKHYEHARTPQHQNCLLIWLMCCSREDSESSCQKIFNWSTLNWFLTEANNVGGGNFCRSQNFMMRDGLQCGLFLLSRPSNVNRSSNNNQQKRQRNKCALKMFCSLLNTFIKASFALAQF